MTGTRPSHTVTLQHWTCPKYGPRYSLIADNGKTAQTYGTEAEARRFADWIGWEIRSAGED